MMDAEGNLKIKLGVSAQAIATEGGVDALMQVRYLESEYSTSTTIMSVIVGTGLYVGIDVGVSALG